MTSDKPRRQGGFTLLELMIVVVIIAILAMIAIPAYSRYAYRARRADGQELLMRIANAQERYYSSFNKYTTDLKDLGYADGTAESEHGYYAVQLNDPKTDGSSYMATATPQGAQLDDACGNLSIDNTGDKQPNASDTSANSNGSCW